MINPYTSKISKANIKVTSNFNVLLCEYLLKKYKHKKNLCLVMGCGDGVLLKSVYKKFKKVIVFEYDKKILKNNIKKLNNKKIYYVNDKFENIDKYSFDYDVIFGNHVLEHVISPNRVLIKLKRKLKKDGKAIFTVPNSNSIHRYIGVEMGIIKTLKSFTENDKLLLHQRVYNSTLFKRHILKSKFKILKIGYYNFKISSQKNMSKIDNKNLYELFKLSLKMNSKYSSNIYAVVTK
tara:strand:+ start:14 stop:721 length:708 start_codon:yes stop_codon:yes gene_type:complete